ncbi:hypothetical protein CDAR_126541 [Caerostris darwini]|uniref:Uncharacterized protein n=1 Tax=Caerostris darwini TaxID=1538125 RepID=A0AAV4RJE9_9ARAC|nr:hypothetical protein CDAR_126541 [Caerostris darwini]
MRVDNIYCSIGNIYILRNKLIHSNGPFSKIRSEDELQAPSNRSQNRPLNALCITQPVPIFKFNPPLFRDSTYSTPPPSTPIISGLITELFRVNRLHADSRLDASWLSIHRPHEYAGENAGPPVIRSRRPRFLTGSSLPKYGNFAT